MLPRFCLTEIPIYANLSVDNGNNLNRKNKNMYTNYNIYAETIETGRTEKGGRLVWFRGCNGENHVDCLDEIFFDNEGKVTFAKSLATVEKGRCDRSCKASGSFIYPYQPPHPKNTEDYQVQVERACAP